MILPDKWIRKAVFNAVNGITVNGEVIPCYDLQATNYDGDNYVIMSTQTASQKDSKCGNGWDATILLDCVNRSRKNAGSRLMADDIAQGVIDALDGLQLSGTAIRISSMRLNAPNDLVTELPSEIITRKLLRYELTIN